MKRQEECKDCEVFKNHQGAEFLFGFYCPIKNDFVQREECACEWMVSDELPF